MDLCDIREIKALLARHGFRFSKSMGQNFLIEGWVPQEIAAAAQADGTCGVLEIGPGIGPLTVQLARRAGRVAAVELDRSLLPILGETLAPFDNVSVIPGDVMKLDLPALLEEQLPGLTPIACANLPYNITTPAITALVVYGRSRLFGLLGREPDTVIPWDEVEMIGGDIVLVKCPAPPREQGLLGKLWDKLVN